MMVPDTEGVSDELQKDYWHTKKIAPLTEGKKSTLLSQLNIVVLSTAKGKHWRLIIFLSSFHDLYSYR